MLFIKYLLQNDKASVTTKWYGNQSLRNYVTICKYRIVKATQTLYLSSSQACRKYSQNVTLSRFKQISQKIKENVFKQRIARISLFKFQIAKRYLHVSTIANLKIKRF